MLCQLPAVAVASRAALPARRRAAAPCLRARRVVVHAAKKKAPEPEPETAELSGPAAAVVYAGLVAVPITYWSEYTLFSTVRALVIDLARATYSLCFLQGAGLQGDVLGGIEGVSYLVLLAVLAVSVQKKTSTGVGLEGALPGASSGSGGALHCLAALLSLRLA